MSHFSLPPLQTEFDALRRGATSPAAFSRHARAQTELLADLLDSLQLWLDKAAQQLKPA